MDQNYKGKVYIYIVEDKYPEYECETNISYLVWSNTCTINMNHLPPYIVELYSQEKYIINLIANSYD